MIAWAPSVIANMNRLIVPLGIVFEPDVAGRGRSGLVAFCCCMKLDNASISCILVRMENIALTTVLTLLRAQSHLQGRFANELGGVHGLSVNELLLLMHLERAPGHRLRRVDLAARLDLSQSGVTRMLAPMEKLGWVERAADSRDARVGYVVLRKAGLRLVQEGTRTLTAQAEALFGEQWNEKEIAALRRLLGRLIANLPGRLAA